MKALARHLLLELKDCNHGHLNDVEFLRDSLKAAAREAGATIVSESFYQFSPHGVSGMVIIAESHLSIHTWPEYNYAAVDIFTCGTTIIPEKAARFIAERLQSKAPSWQEFERGMMPEVPAAYPKQKVSIS